MSSIYSFFASLLPDRQIFRSDIKLENFPFDESMLACRNKGSFPDLILRSEPETEDYPGGELIELKDSRSYSVASFNSTIPSSRKNLSEIITGPNSLIYQQLISSGEDPFRNPIREVYYLIRGKKHGNIKVCLVLGSFFETVGVEDLIRSAFAQVIRDGLEMQGSEIDSETKDQLIRLMSHQAYFRKARNVPKAAVKLRFRVMTEVKKEGNILNSQQYPQIGDNTLNLILPCHTEKEMAFHLRKTRACVEANLFEQLTPILLHHPLNGQFLAFQIPI